MKIDIFLFIRLNKEQVEMIEPLTESLKKSLKDLKSKYWHFNATKETHMLNNFGYSLEKKSEKLAKEAKGYLDSMRGKLPCLFSNVKSLKCFYFLLLAMTTAQVRIATTMENFYNDTAPMGQSGTEYKRVIEKLDEEARSNLVCKGLKESKVYTKISSKRILHIVLLY